MILHMYVNTKLRKLKKKINVSLYFRKVLRYSMLRIYSRVSVNNNEWSVNYLGNEANAADPLHVTYY